MPTRAPVETLEELDGLDATEVLEGYNDGRAGEPEPGDNRSKAYWHGWRNGMMDSYRLPTDVAAMNLAASYLKRMRQSPQQSEPG